MKHDITDDDNKKIRRGPTTLKSDYIEQYVHKYYGSTPNAIQTARSSLLGFFTLINKNPDAYFSKKHPDVFYQKDIEDYIAKILDLSPKAIKLRISYVKMLLMRNGIELKTMFWSDLMRNKKEKGVILTEHIPTNEELEQILRHANIFERAFILVLASSGMRVGELLLTPIANYHFDEHKSSDDPVLVDLEGMATKSGCKRYTFISPEAVKMIKEWLRCRNEYMDKRYKRILHLGHVKREDYIDSPLMFPFSYETLAGDWVLLLKKSGLYKRDVKTSIATMHLHTIRKFAKDRMNMVMSHNVVDFIIGHQSQLNKIYDIPPVKASLQEYKKAIPLLNITEHVPDMTDTNKKIDDQDKRIEELQRENQDGKIERLELKQQLLEYKTELDKWMNKEYKRKR